MPLPALVLVVREESEFSLLKPPVDVGVVAGKIVFVHFVLPLMRDERNGSPNGGEGSDTPAELVIITIYGLTWVTTSGGLSQ